MPTRQDTFADESNLNETLGSEVTGGELISEDLQSGNVLSFDGVNDSIAVGNPPSGIAGISAVTVSAWIKANSNSTGEILGQFLEAGDKRVVRWELFAGTSFLKTRSLFYADGTSANFGRWDSDNDVVPLNEWVHVALVDDLTAGTSTHYVNGVSVAVSETVVGTGSPTSIISKDSDMEIGNVEQGNLPFDGDIADIQVYDAVLTAAEVEYLHSSGKFGTDPTTTNLVSQWLLDEGTGTSATDNAGSNTGTITGATWDTDTDLAHITSTWKNSNNDTLVRGAYSFDGVNDYIEVPDNDDLTSQDLSVGAWVRILGDGLASSNSIVSKFSSIGDQREFLLQYRSDADVFRPYISQDGTSGTSTTVDSRTQPEVGQWYHVMFTYDNSDNELNVYVNGISENTATPSVAGIYNSTSDLVIGDIDPLGSTFNGDISDVQVYDAALTASEIWDIYANSKPRSTNQVSRWLLSGNALDTWGSNDGTVSGAVALPQRASTPTVGDSLNQREVASFDGTNDYVDVDDVVSDLSSDTQGSISAWIKYSDDTENSFIVSLADTNADSYIGGFRLVRGDIKAMARDSSSAKWQFETDTTLTKDVWHHLVMVQNGTSPVLYVDGQLVDITFNTSTDKTYWVNDFSGGLDNASIGSVLYNSVARSTYFTGNISDVAVYDDARTASEILTDYENGYIDESNANLVSYWKLDGDYLDAVGSNNGTNSGSTMIDSIDAPLSNEGDTQVTLDISALGFTDSIFVRDYIDSIDPTRPFALTEWSLDYTGAVTFVPRVMYY